MAESDQVNTRIAGRTSLRSFWKHYLVAGVLLIAATRLEQTPAMLLATLATAVLVHVAVVICFGTRWWINGADVVQSRGVVSRHTEQLRLADLSQVDVKQDLIERLLDVGSVSVANPEDSHPTLTLRGVRRPHQLMRLLKKDSDSR